MWKKAGRLGFIGIHYPEEFGGQGLSLLENVLVIETFWISSRSVSEVFRERDMKLINLMKFLKIPLFPPFVKSVRLETEGD
jgi:alkylation response protein AidB-like acyl-CoA dehydrogenase